MKNKNVEKYLDRIFEKTPARRFVPLQLPWSLMPFLALGLGCWSLYGSGPEGAMTSAHALTWAFIMIDMFLIGIMGLAGFGRQFIKKDHPVTSDRMLFMGERRGTFLGKFTAATDVFMYLALAIMAAWPVAIVILVMLTVAELSSKAIIKSNTRTRYAELAEMSSAELDAISDKKDEETEIMQEGPDFFVNL